MKTRDELLIAQAAEDIGLSYREHTEGCDRLARDMSPLDDTELVERVARAIRRNKFERTGRLACYDDNLPLAEAELSEGRAAIAAIEGGDRK